MRATTYRISAACSSHARRAALACLVLVGVCPIVRGEMLSANIVDHNRGDEQLAPIATPGEARPIDAALAEPVASSPFA